MTYPKSGTQPSQLTSQQFIPTSPTPPKWFVGKGSQGKHIDVFWKQIYNFFVGRRGGLTHQLQTVISGINYLITSVYDSRSLKYSREMAKTEQIFLSLEYHHLGSPKILILTKPF